MPVKALLSKAQQKVPAWPKLGRARTGASQPKSKQGGQVKR